MKQPQDDRDFRIAALESRLAEVEETLRAIGHGEVDALVVGGPEGDRIFTLQSAETPYRLLVEQMNEGALLLQRDGTVLYANLRFSHFAGAPLEQIIGSCWLRFFAQANQLRLPGLLESLGTHGGKEEAALQRADGSLCAVQISLAPMKRDQLEAIAVVVTDLTDRKAAEEAVRSSNARLRDMVSELEHFSYSISHDMRAPLRAMKSFAVLLQEDCATCTRADNRDLLERISTAATRLDRLIEGSLEYARIVREEVLLQPVDLSALLAGLVQTYPNLLPDKADIQLAPGLPVVLGNDAALTQCFSNLLGNAVKFVPPGTRPHVRVWAEPRQDRVRIWIEDNGIGIPETDQSRIFDMFFRGCRGYEGTGVGLAIARKVVERVGGSIGVESKEGAGSRFWVELSVASAR